MIVNHLRCHIRAARRCARAHHHAKAHAQQNTIEEKDKSLFQDATVPLIIRPFFGR